MKKYSYELKLKIVKEKEEGYRDRYLAKKYKIKSKGQPSLLFSCFLSCITLAGCPLMVANFNLHSSRRLMSVAKLEAMKNLMHSEGCLLLFTLFFYTDSPKGQPVLVGTAACPVEFGTVPCVEKNEN